MFTYVIYIHTYIITYSSGDKPAYRAAGGVDLKGIVTRFNGDTVGHGTWLDGIRIRPEYSSIPVLSHVLQYLFKCFGNTPISNVAYEVPVQQYYTIFF